MKTTVLFFLFLVGLPSSRGQEIGTKYSGTTKISGLGTLEFPPGEWLLEFRRPRPTPNPAHRPDYFGFRKISNVPERLGFRLYEPDTAMAQLVRYLDGIGEDLGEGAPREELGIPAGDGATYPMRLQPTISHITPTTDDIAYSFISIRPNQPLNWLCHTHLFSRHGWVFVAFHASPSVTNPDTVRDIAWAPDPPIPRAGK